MNKFGRRKIALTLACALVVGGKVQAMSINKPQNRQTLAAVGGATSRVNQSVKQGLSKNQKLAIGGAAALLVVASAVGFTILGFKYFGKKNKDDNNIDKIPNVKEKNKDNIQQKEKKGKYYEKNQKMIKDGTAKLGDELQKRYDAIRKLILNYKDNDLSSHISNIYDTIDDCIIQNSDNIKNEHREKYIKMLDEFIDIYSGKKELTKFDAEDNTNFGLNVEVQSKSIDYNIYQSEIQIQKFNDNGDVIFHMKIDLENLID